MTESIPQTEPTGERSSLHKNFLDDINSISQYGRPLEYMIGYGDASLIEQLAQKLGHKIERRAPNTANAVIYFPDPLKYFDKFYAELAKADEPHHTAALGRIMERVENEKLVFDSSKEVAIRVFVTVTTGDRPTPLLLTEADNPKSENLSHPRFHYMMDHISEQLDGVDVIYHRISDGLNWQVSTKGETNPLSPYSNTVYAQPA